MSKQEQKKGFFGTVANLFKSDKEECCSVSFEEIEDNTAVEQKQNETQIEAKTCCQTRSENN